MRRPRLTSSGAAPTRALSRRARHARTGGSAALGLGREGGGAASDDGTARVWDATTGAEVVTLGGHTGSVAAAAFSPDGKRVVTASWDRTARVWDATTGAEVV